MRTVLGIVVVALLVAACSESSGDPEPWQEAGSYTYTLDSQCGERDVIGTFSITVSDHEVEDASALDESGQALLDSSGLGQIPTLQQRYDEFWQAQWGADVADKAEIQHAPVDGHPLIITIDWDADAVDDAACYVISEYQATG